MSICRRFAIFVFLVALALPQSDVSAASNGSTLVVLGDSISAAFGMETEQSWVHLLGLRLEESTYGHAVVNASVSGETTQGGLARLPALLDAHSPDILILQLGGNDGLRGFPLDVIEQNLDAAVAMAQDAGSRVLVVGMVLPPNYGRRYTQGFEALYETIADRRDVPLVPVLLDGVLTPQSLLQPDRIHPLPEAQPLILDGIWPSLEPMLTP